MFPDAPPAITTTVLAPAETPGAQLGTSVSYAESYLAAGAIGTGSGAGMVQLWHGPDWTHTDWSPVATLTAPAPEANAFYGASVSLFVPVNPFVEPSYGVVGEPRRDAVGPIADAGAAYLYTMLEEGQPWTLVTALASPAPAPGEQFGFAVGVTRTLVAVSALQTGGGSGVVHVWRRDELGVWNYEAALLPSDGAAGDLFGSSISIDGADGAERIAVGAPGADLPATANCGKVYLFSYSAGSWTQAAPISAAAPVAGDSFGRSVSLDGLNLAVGTQNASPFEKGRAFIFSRGSNSDPFTQAATLVAPDADFADLFGAGVSLSGDLLAVGAFNDDVGLNLNQGSVYLFGDSGSGWTFSSKVSRGDGAGNDLFGSAISLDGEFCAVGTPFDNVGASADEGSVTLVWARDCNEDGIPGRCLGLPGDFTGDGHVNGFDFGILLGNWGRVEPGFPADMNGDGEINGFDLGIFFGNWTG